MSGSKQNDVNGVACHACARHGCYCPGSMVDILEGEKQAVIDYSGSETMKTINMEQMRKFLAIYDIMCQYYKKRHLQFSNNPIITMPPDTNMRRPLDNSTSMVTRIAASSVSPHPLFLVWARSMGRF